MNTVQIDWDAELAELSAGVATQPPPDRESVDGSDEAAWAFSELANGLALGSGTGACPARPGVVGTSGS